MTDIKLDPKIVTEIAEAAFRRAVRQGRDLSVERAILTLGVPDPITTGTFTAYRNAAGAEYDRMAAALPVSNGRQQDEQDGPALDRIWATLENHAARGCVSGDYLDADIRSILDGRTMWKKAAEAAQGKQEADVRAVRAAVDAAGALPIPQFESMPELAAALNALLEQFEDRIKVIDEAESLARLRAFRTTLDEQGKF